MWLSISSKFRLLNMVRFSIGSYLSADRLKGFQLICLVSNSNSEPEAWLERIASEAWLERILEKENIYI